MISINNVYQKVLALANKEQRGYITPQEFNLLADKAQNEIYENYFYQLNMAQVKPKSQGTHEDIVEAIETKLEGFIAEDSITVETTGVSINTIPSNSFRIISISDSTTNTPATKTSYRELDYILNSPLTKPNSTRRIYTVNSDGYLKFYPSPSAQLVDGYTIRYYKSPNTPKWTYVIINDKALYNSSADDAQNFELHISEEENLVSKILNLAGLTIRQPEVQQSGMMQTQMNKQEQNS